jgi:glycosyltransferase involved in cell wall biosynthesis
MPGSLEDALLAYSGEADFDLVVPAFVTQSRNPGGQTVFGQIELPLAVGPGRRPATPASVSCLMVTRDRLELARLSVACFLRQTWPRKELIVLDESADERLRSWIASRADPRIRVFRVPSEETLGELRNRAIDVATGDFVCQWDDDDLQHPARLELAFAAMAATATSTSLLAHEMMWMPLHQRLCIASANPRPHENTLLTRREFAPRYPALARGEDTPAVERLLQAERAVLLAVPQLYMYVIHGRNTWDAAHAESIWEASVARTEGPDTAARLARFASAFPVREYAAVLPPPVPAPPPKPAAEDSDGSLLLDYDGASDATFSLRGFLARAGKPITYQVSEVRLNLNLGPTSRRGPLPLVSCLMVTRDRFELAQFSIRCFQRQSWPNRELIVLDGSADDRLRDWIASLGDPALRWISSRGLNEPLGALRNRSIAAAHGDVFCIWDDDDLQHPVRLEVAVAAMAATRAPVCFLAREMLWMIGDRRIGVLARDPWPQEGTLMALRSAGLRYPALERAEDTPAVRDLLLRHQGILVDAPELYVYAIHGNNTWDRGHLERLWSFTRDRSEGAGLAARLARLARAYPLEEYAAAVRDRNARLARPLSRVAT